MSALLILNIKHTAALRSHIIVPPADDNHDMHRIWSYTAMDSIGYVDAYYFYDVYGCLTDDVIV